MDDEIRNRLKALRDRLAPTPGFPHVLASGADITELIDCLVAMNPKPKVKVTVTNNIAAEDRVGDACAKLVAAEVRLAQARRRADAEGLVGLPKISPDAIKFTGQLAGIGAQGLMETLSVKRPWWKFWSK